MSRKRPIDIKEELGDGGSTMERVCRSCKKNIVEIDDGDDDFLMIKAEHNIHDIAKFQIRPSAGIDKLVEEVAKRLGFRIGSFKLKYEDEDWDEVLLACDDDLRLCAKNFGKMGKSFLRVFVDRK
ncbi:hypothetical protein ABFX02_01G105200 [Erythranthe guttata]